MKIAHKTFHHQVIELDGNDYEDCKFLNCELVFGGTAGVYFVDCVIQDCNWKFQGYAAVTLNFLSALSRGARPGSDVPLLDELIDAIKHGRLGAFSTSVPEPALA